MKIFLIYLKNYRKEAILAPLFKMIEAAFELFIPLVISDIIKESIPNQNTNRLIISFVILLCLAFIGFLCAVIAQYFSAKAATGFAKEIKYDLFKHIETLSYSELDEIGTSSLITRMTSDINQMQTGINMFLRLFLRSPFVVFGAMIMAFIVNVKMALIFVVTIPLLSIIVFLIMHKTIPLFKEQQTKLDTLLRKTRENIKGVRVIRAFGKEENENEEFKQNNNDFTQFQIYVNKISNLMNPLTYLVINVAIIAIIYFGSRLINNNNLLNGDVVALYNYMSQILIELLKLANLLVTLTKAIACSKRVFSVFKISSSQKYLETSKLEPKTNIAIEMKNVSLTYKKNQNHTLENINLSLKEGQTLGVIGGTGSGKTSLINLIARYYDATIGSIYLFGTDIKNYSKKDIRKMVSVASQKAVLFNGTIRDNLTISDPKNISDDAIFKALEIAQATDIVKSKENGLNEKILQGGKNLSGGQKQRLNIARSLLKNSSILILDDSSSALDYLTDYNLRKAIKNMDNKPTTIITSQRASSVMDCDLILVLDEGKCVGYGTHDSLLENSEVYKEIYYTQFEKEDK